MKMKRKGTIAVVLVLLMIASTVGSYAATVFSDVANNHWAKDHISKMSEKGIIKGVEDSATLRFYFKPENPVTYIEAVQMIFQTLKATNKLKDNAGLIAKHQTTLTQSKIPTWAHESMAYALEYSIVHKDEVKNFIKNNVQVNAKRVDIAVFLGKALDMDDDIDPLPVLGFVDSELIIRAAVPYVDLLVKKKVISGDTNNKFNPNNAIRRAEMATMCSKAYDLLNTGSTDVTTPIPTQPETPKLNERTIEFIAKDTKTIVVKDDAGTTEVYRLNNAYIKIFGVYSSIEDLKVGNRVRLEFDQDGNVKLVEMDYSVAEFDGTVETIRDYTDYTAITVADKYNSSNKKTFKAYSDVVVRNSDRNVLLTTLKVGDKVSVKATGDKATRITIDSNYVEYDGILDTEVYFRETPMIKVRVKTDIMELAVADNVSVTRNGRTRADSGRLLGIDDLVKGDIVTITLEYNKVSKVIATSMDVKKDISGVIKSYTIGTPSKITISDDKNVETTYDISNTVTIVVDGKGATLYDLRPNYGVKLKFESNSVVRIEAESAQAKERVTGDVVKVYANHNIVTVRILDKATSQYTTRPISVNSDTVIVGTDGRTTSLSRLVEKMEIFIDGYLEDDFFIAEKIIILKN